MMKNTIAALPPEKVIDVFNEVRGRGQSFTYVAETRGEKTP